MEYVILLLFFVGYMAIAMEHKLQLDKTVPAILMASIMWAIIAYFHLNVFHLVEGVSHLVSLEEKEGVEKALFEKFGETAGILIFLIGAMTIVEIVDLHRGFDVIKRFVKTKSKRKLLFIVSILGFFLSAIIDNLTATIVLITILRKIITQKEDRMWYASVTVIATNAGGAWSPIGDVTTTMLWIANKVTSAKLAEYVFLPSIISLLIPLVIISRRKVFSGNVIESKDSENKTYKHSAFMLYLGLAMIVFVPIFKSITHLPPYLGMVFSLGVVWFAAEYISNFKFNFDDGMSDEDIQEKKKFISPHRALAKIEMSSILFFLGILLTVAALESLGFLFHFASWLEAIMPSQEMVVILLGISSAVIDNVPLVAASIGMFRDPIDHEVWHFIAFSAGTGGSMLIIGSAAGVAAMGMEKISFDWYLKNITGVAFLGFITGCLFFIFSKSVGLY